MRMEDERPLEVWRITFIVIVLLAISWSCAYPRDLDGKFSQNNPGLHQWFDGLRSGKGPCCSDADGTAVTDPDWENNNGHYRVKVDGQWVDVPDEAVITEPNRAGLTMVWPIRYWSDGTLKLVIRCFMPGTMG